MLGLTFSWFQVVLFQSRLLLWICFVVVIPLLLDLFGQQEHLVFISYNSVNNHSDNTTTFNSCFHGDYSLQRNYLDLH